MLSGKAGLVHVHMGKESQGLQVSILFSGLPLKKPVMPQLHSLSTDV